MKGAFLEKLRWPFHDVWLDILDPRILGAIVKSDVFSIGISDDLSRLTRSSTRLDWRSKLHCETWLGDIPNGFLYSIIQRLENDFRPGNREVYDHQRQGDKYYIVMKKEFLAIRSYSYWLAIFHKLSSMYNPPEQSAHFLCFMLLDPTLMNQSIEHYWEMDVVLPYSVRYLMVDLVRVLIQRHT